MRKPIQVGDLLSWIAVEECVVLVLSVGQVCQGGLPTTTYTVLTATGEINKYPDYVIKHWRVISSAAV
jgi:hypothetical protein